jgi:hypothetical protein
MNNYATIRNKQKEIISYDYRRESIRTLPVPICTSSGDEVDFDDDGVEELVELFPNQEKDRLFGVTVCAADVTDDEYADA